MVIPIQLPDKWILRDRPTEQEAKLCVHKYEYENLRQQYRRQRYWHALSVARQQVEHTPL